MRKYLYLYLTLACFLALIALFVVDGYMGVYDTVYITAGEREQRIEADFWLRAEVYDSHYYYDYAYEPAETSWGEKVFFRYEVDNRQFSSYSVDVEVSLWQFQQKVLDLILQPLEIAAFEKGELEWVVDTSELEPAPPEVAASVAYTLIIKRGEIERRIILYLNETYSSKTLNPIR